MAISSHHARLAIGAVALLALAGAVAAQPAPPAAPPASGPWFGLAPPRPVTGQVLDFAHADLPMIPPPPAAGAPELEGAKLHRYVVDVVAHAEASRAAGERNWGRLAASPWAEMTADYVVRHFQAAGLMDVRKMPVPFSGPETLPVDWKVTLIGAPAFGTGTADLDLPSAFPMAAGAEGAAAQGAQAQPGRRTRSARGKIVYLGAATAAERALNDVRGKIAVVRVEPAPAVFHQAAGRMSQQLTAAGAAGVLMIYDAPGNMHLRYGNCSPAPCFTLGGEDGDFLVNAIARAARAGVLDQMEVALSITEETKVDQHGWLVVGKVPGRQAGGENIVVSAHGDSWFSGANDNASGVAGLIGMARHYAKARPQHDIYFSLSPGHHSPTGGLGALVAAYPQLAPRNIVAINLEHIGGQATYRSYVGPGGRLGAPLTRYGTPSSSYVPVNGDSPGREVSGEPLTPMVRKVIAAAASKTGFTAPTQFGLTTAGEIGPFVRAGGTAIQNVETNIWYHTTGDTVDTVSPSTLQRAMLFYRDIVDQMDRMTRVQVRAGS